MTTLGIDPVRTDQHRPAAERRATASPPSPVPNAGVFGAPNARVPKPRMRSTTSGDEPVVRED